MKTRVGSSRFTVSFLASLAGAAVLALTGCSGSVADVPTDDGIRVQEGASADDYKEALANMEPVTLTYQTGAHSQKHVTAWKSLEFKEAVEELSGGKISIDLQYNEAIVPYSEIESALIDGRLDIAYMLPVYDPSAYPVSAAFVAASSLGGSSPIVDELALQAALTELAWNTPELIDEFESKGLSVLDPFIPNGLVFSFCADPATSAADWKGQQTRVSSSAQVNLLQSIDAIPVSIDHGETYEALQRRTIDCTLSSAMPAADLGFIEVASELSYSDEVGFGRGPNVLVAGTKYQELPVAAQQLIYGQMSSYFMNAQRSNFQGNADTMKILREHGGSVSALDDDVAATLRQQAEVLVDDQIQQGIVGESFKDDLLQAIDKWQGIVRELGYEDEGDFEDFDQWYTDGSVDLTPLIERLNEEVYYQHRPN